MFGINSKLLNESDKLLGRNGMKIYTVVKYTDVEVFTSYGEERCVTETEVLDSYGNKQDANIECKHLNGERVEDNVIYDVIVSELY